MAGIMLVIWVAVNVKRSHVALIFNFSWYDLYFELILAAFYLHIHKFYLPVGIENGPYFSEFLMPTNTDCVTVKDFSNNWSSCIIEFATKRILFMNKSICYHISL